MDREKPQLARTTEYRLGGVLCPATAATARAVNLPEIFPFPFSPFRPCSAFLSGDTYRKYASELRVRGGGYSNATMNDGHFKF